MEKQRVVGMENQWPQTFITGKIGTDSLCFYRLGSGQCVAVSKSSPLTHKNDLSVRHFYLLQ